MIKEYKIESFKQARHKKTGDIYNVINYPIINASNKNQYESDFMILYEKDSVFFVRDKEEFYKKFELLYQKDKK